MKNNSKSLSDWADELQRRGRYTFTREDVQKGLNLSDGTLNKALQRLSNQGRVIRPRREFYVIVPLEYSSNGSVPPEWFINDLMSFLGSPYYVGCLSAAAIYGAAHQRPQELQVVVPSHLRIIDLQTLRIRFFQFAGMAGALTQPRRTHTGDYPVSTPEWTAIDLIRFQKHYGSLDAVATVFAELGEALDKDNLVLAAKRERSNAHLQRLGWMLELVGFKSLTGSLNDYVMSRNPSFTPLNSAAKRRGGPRDGRWRVIVNEKPQSEL
jgi:predicted transcriptional regulator of viral defense system